MAMKHAEMTTMLDEALRMERLALRREEELIDGTLLAWMTSWSREGLTYRFEDIGLRIAEMSAAALRRCIEIKTALESWQRNEGDWPTARTP